MLFESKLNARFLENTHISIPLVDEEFMWLWFDSKWNETPSKHDVN